jgi:hypothetical protein
LKLGNRLEQVAARYDGLAGPAPALSSSGNLPRQSAERITAAVRMHDPKLNQFPERTDGEPRDADGLGDGRPGFEPIDTVDLFGQPAAASLGEAQAMKTHGALLRTCGESIARTEISRFRCGRNTDRKDCSTNSGLTRDPLSAHPKLKRPMNSRRVIALMLCGAGSRSAGSTS